MAMNYHSSAGTYVAGARGVWYMEAHGLFHDTMKHAHLWLPVNQPLELRRLMDARGSNLVSEPLKYVPIAINVVKACQYMRINRLRAREDDRKTRVCLEEWLHLCTSACLSACLLLLVSDLVACFQDCLHFLCYRFDVAFAKAQHLRDTKSGRIVKQHIAIKQDEDFMLLQRWWDRPEFCRVCQEAELLVRRGSCHNIVRITGNKVSQVDLSSACCMTKELVYKGVVAIFDS